MSGDRATSRNVDSPKHTQSEVTADGSVTSWFRLLEGEQDAGVQRLWERYFLQLLDVARRKMRDIPRQVTDEEDIALSAFHTFCQAARHQRLPDVTNRDDLWRTLVLITAGKVTDQRRYLGTQKRSAAVKSLTDADLDRAIGEEPDPAFVVQIAEQFDQLLDRLGDENLRQTALFKLDGFTNLEIADRCDCSERTVKRRLTVIRRIWMEADETTAKE